MRNPSSWTKFSFTSKETNIHNQSSSIKTTTQASGFFSLFTGGGNASFSRDTVNTDVKIKNLEVEFDLVQVQIISPWFRPEFLKSNGWKFSDNAPYKILSDGQSPASGALPYYTTAAIFIKDVKFKSEDFAKQYSKVVESFDVKASVGWGPFSVSVGTAGGSTDEKLHITVKDGAITIQGIQLIGFICTSLSKLPNPNPDVQNWV